MAYLAAICLLAVASEPQCSPQAESCVVDVSDGTFANAWYSTRLTSVDVKKAVLQPFERDPLCSLNNWVTAEQCHERCNFRLEITQPADLRMTVCLVDNDYAPYAPDAHIDLHHPLNGVEHDIVNISASASSCSLSGNADVSGKIALQGSACYDSSVARTARAGGAVMSIKTSSYKYNRVKQTFSSWGSGWGLDDFPSAVMPRHHSLLLWDALERGAAVRGRVVHSCDALPQLSAMSSAGLGDGCPYPRMAGMCNEMPLPQDRLCSRCPLELRVAGVAVCLWGNTLLPRKSETLLQNTVQLPLTTTADEVVVASALPDDGCSASDYTQLAGKIVVVRETRSCLPLTQVRMAQARGVRAVVMVPIFDYELITVVEGPSLGVVIPVHAINYTSYTALKAAAEQVQVVAGVGSILGAGVLAVGEAIPSRHNWVWLSAASAVTPPAADALSATWEWNAVVATCVVLIAAEVLLLSLLIAHHHRHAVQMPASTSRRRSVPLGLASIGLSLSLLVIVAAVAFVLTSAAGQESLDTAVQDGRSASLTTHTNAVQNIETLNARMRVMIIDTVLQALVVFETTVVQTLFAHTVAMSDFDGRWSSFISAYPKFRLMADYRMRGIASLLTTNGFYANSLLVTDDRTEAERGDGVAGDVASNNTGFPYGLAWHGDWWSEYYPTATFNYSNVMGNAWRSPLSLFNSSSSPTERVWFVSRRTSDTYPIHDPLIHAISLFVPFFNKGGQYWGVFGGATALEQIGISLRKAVGVENVEQVDAPMYNMTALIVDRTDGTILADSRGNNVYTESVFLYMHPVWWFETERHVKVLHTMRTTPPVQVKALGNYLDKQDGWVEHTGEFDQQAEWSHQHLYLAKLRAAGGAAVDESGEDVKAESRGGGCGTCTVMDSDLGREVFAFDGDNVLHIYNNLTVGAASVAKTRTSPVGQAWASNLPEYAESIVMSDGTECVARRPPGGGALGCYLRPAFTRVRHYTISMRVRPDDVEVNRQVRGAQLFSQTFEGETNARMYADGELSINVLNRACRVKGVPGGLPVGRWSTVTVVTNSVAPFTCSVYINGHHHGTSFYSRNFDVVHFQSKPYYAGRHFHGRMDNLMLFGETLTTAEVMSLHTAGELVRDVPSKHWFVGVKAAVMDTDSEQGATWSVAAIVPREDIMRQVDENNRVTMSNLAVQEDNTNKKLERKTNETVLVIVVIALFSVGVFLVFNSMLTRPFAQYAVLMTEAAVMKVDAVPEGEPFIRELRAMNSAMCLMLRNLKEYKSYMPHNLQLPGQTTDGSEAETHTSGSSHSAKSRRASLARTLSSTPAAVQVVRQDLMCTLTKKRFSFVVVNMKDWHEMATGSPDAKLLDLHGAVLHCVLAVFNSNKGISEVFSGDRFACTFNAAKCATSHRVGAVSSAYQIVNDIENLADDFDYTPTVADSNSLSATASVVSGEGRVGNMGNELMKRFTCVSPVMTWGYALERFCRSVDARVMADAFVYEEARHSFRIMIADAVEFPKRHVAPINVAIVLGTTTAAVDEWMYELEAAAKSDPFREWNEWALRVFQEEFDIPGLAELEEVSRVTAHPIVFSKLRDATKRGSFTPSRIPFH